MDDGDISSQRDNMEMDISAISSTGAPEFEHVSKRMETGSKIKQEKRCLSPVGEPVAKKCRTEQDEQEEKMTVSHHTDLWTSQSVKHDHSYMCPLDSDKTTASENDKTGDHLQIPARSDINSDSASSSLGKHEAFFTPNWFPSFQNVKSVVNASPLDAEGKTEYQRNVAYKCQFEEEELETESNLWKLRANRVQQILSSVDKEDCTFHRCKRMGIEFNVGFGPKKNFSVDSLHRSSLLEMAKFALAMNSSQQDFIMEILEYNFDLGPWSKDQRNTFVSEVMSKVWQLKNYEDAVKRSTERAAPVSSVNMVSQSVGSVSPDVSSLSRTECDVAPTCSSDPHAETKEHRVDLYPFCKDIGLKLNVISSQENKKLDINKLTNGAMTEVTNFAEKLCGTFDEICLDVLRHNFDFDQPDGDSDLAKTILSVIPVIRDLKNLLKISDSKNIKTLKDTVANVSSLITDCQNYTNLDACSADIPKAPVTDQIVESSIFKEEESWLRLWPWKLRANQIKQILSVPHLEHCPLYSYSRCKRLGIDFNVGSGVKQNLDQKLLTNGLMVEISTFAEALESSQKDFITEILEYNFRLTFNSEICRGVFALQVQERVQKCHRNSNKFNFLNKPFNIPDSSIINHQTAYPQCQFCPKCYEDRNHKHFTDQSDPVNVHHSHPHAMAGTISAEASCSAQKPIKKPPSVYQATKKMVMNNYPSCKNIGLSLFVNKDKPQKKLSISLLTVAVMREVSHFAKTLCGKKSKVINDVLKHNFSIGMKNPNMDHALLFLRSAAKRYHGPTWFNDRFVIHPHPQRNRDSLLSKKKEVCAPQKNEWKETITNRKLTLQSKKVKQRTESQEAINTNVYSLRKRRLLGDKKNMEIPENVLYKYDMKEEEMEVESNLWKLRVNRIKQILSLQGKEYCAFTRSNKAGLEFDVGFGPKQNFSVDSLTSSVPLEIARFALAINSSQEDFIMEILEYNFDFGQWSGQERKRFSSELMNRVRWLKNREDAVKLSKQIFELPALVSSANMANQSMDSVRPEVSNTSKMTECEAPALCSAETTEDSVDLYPFCKDIGLKLNVISSQENKKLDINKLTNGAMTEVTNFAEKLCGTFDQICLDVLRHNLDLDEPDGDSDLARTILAQIPVILQQRSLSNVASFKKFKPKMFKKLIKMVTCTQNNPNVDECSADSSQAPMKEQEAMSSADTKQDNDTDLLMWRLREDQIQRILTVPHGENCLFYSYSRCKKLGIDFNVASGIKPNLDPKLLTNGMVLEINTFATELLSSSREFITKILEYNLDLNFSSEHCRDVFALQVAERLNAYNFKGSKHRYLRMPFQLPDTSSIVEDINLKKNDCPKCSQERNCALTDTVSEANCSAQKSTKDLTSAFQAAGKLLMDTYRLCKQVGLSLLVDKDKPKEKLNPNVLTRGVMKEVTAFAKRLCGTKNKVINDIIEHNFNLGMRNRYRNIAQMLSRLFPLFGDAPAWFDKSFDFQPYSQRGHSDMRKVTEASAAQENERKETSKKRKLALQTKKEKAALLKNNTKVKSKRIAQSTDDCYPICTEIGLDLDVTSKSGDKEKLDLKLLTRAAMMEIYKFLCRKEKHYFPNTLYDILDYNFDLSSQHHRCWEFSISTAAKVKTMAKNYRKNMHKENEVFKLPFVLEHKELQAAVQKDQHKRGPNSTVEKPVVTQIEVHIDDQQLRCHPGPATIMQMTGSSVDGGGDEPLWADIQIKKEVEDDSDYGIMKPEMVSVEIGEPVDSLGYNLSMICPNSESHIKTEIEPAQSYNVAEPQISEGHVVLAESSVNMDVSTETVKCEIPVKKEEEEEEESQGYSIITVCQVEESTQIKEEELDIKQEQET